MPTHGRTSHVPPLTGNHPATVRPDGTRVIDTHVHVWTLDDKPGLTVVEAHRARTAVVEHRVKDGDSLAGYKIASGWSGIPSTEPRAEPIVNSLMHSGIVAHCGEYRFAGAPKVAVEAECAVMLSRDLEGPGITPADVLHAIEGFLPAIEIVPQSPGPRNAPHRTLLGKFTGGDRKSTRLNSSH